MARKLTDKHLNAYKEGGKLKKLFDAITEDPELSFEIRVNNEVMVYYHKDKILTITLDRNGEPKITILSSKYYKDRGRKPSVCFDNPHNLISMDEMRTYFKEAKKLVYTFKMGAEFNVQQNIALGNHSYDGRYLVVDMEWMFSQAEIPSEKRMKSKTKIDLVIVDTVPNDKGFNDIYLAELKLGLGATQGDSGTIDHVDKTNEIINRKEACKSLQEDVASIIKQKTELKIIEGTKKEFRFGAKPKMMLILAYRGERERIKLEAEYTKAKKRAKEIGMEEPVCIMHNALIKLSVEK